MRILSNVNILGTLDLDNVQNAAADTDRFLVQDANGVVKFRTGAEVASDIGASVGFVSTVKHEVKLGEAIATGQAVYVTSADGTNMIVSKASNNSDATSSKTLGLIETGGIANDIRYVITEGLLAGLNTSTAVAGDPVWLGTNGNLLFGLANKPVAPAHMVFIGVVTRVQQNNGEIFVKVQNGFELEELHNVLITGTPVDKAVIQYDTATGLWKNSTIGGVTGSGVAGQVAYWNGTNTQTGSNNLFWDATNNRLGVKTNTPTYSLSVNGGISLGHDGGIAISFPTGQAIRSLGGIFLDYGNGGSGDLNIRSGSSVISSAIFYNNGNINLGVNGQSVGIGQPAPVAKLDVLGALAVSGALPNHTTNRAVLEQNGGKIALRAYGPTAGSGFIAFNTGGGGDTADSEKVRITATGDVGIGTTAPVSRMHIVGSGNTSATTALTVQNSDGTNLFRVVNDNTIFLGGTTYVKNSTTSARFFAGGSFTESMHITAPNNRQVLRIVSGNIVNNIDDNSSIFEVNQTITSNATITNVSNTILSGPFNASSGSVNYNSLLINVSINQTGGANGITRGLYINPTLTAAADWRSIQWTNNTGWGLYGSGTANNYLAGFTGIGTTTMTYAFNVVNTGATYVAGFRGGSNSYIVVGDTSLAGESGINFRNSSGQGFVGIGGTILGMSATSGANTITFSTGGNERVRVTSAGDVGIGTSAPSYKLDVVGTGVFGIRYNRTDGAAADARIVLQSGTASTNIHQYGESHASLASIFRLSSSGGIEFMTSGVAAARITTAQNFLIGSSSDDTVNKLQVTGGVRVSGSTTFNGNMTNAFASLAGGTTVVGGITGVSNGFRIDVNTSNEYQYAFRSGANALLFTIANTGIVTLNTYGTGARTGTVAYNLAVDASGNIIETAGGVVDGSGTATYLSKWQDANTLTNSLLYENGTNIVNIATASTRNVMFRLYSNGQTSNQLEIGQGLASLTDNIGYVFNTASAALAFGTAYTERMRISSTGDVGIGTTTPNEKLHVAGNIHAFASGGINASLLASTAAGSTTVWIRSSGVSYFNGGNVGIGTTTAGETLHVVGRQRIVTSDTYGLNFWKDATPTVAASMGIVGTGFSFNIYNGTSWTNNILHIAANGGVGIAQTALTGRSLSISKNINGATVAQGVIQEGQVQSDVTNTAYGFRNIINTVNALTIGEYIHFYAQEGTIGTTNSITNQYGYSVGSNLTSATNNFGFYGNIASGTGRWNIYMAGTAANYLAGRLAIGSTNTTGGWLSIFGNAADRAISIATTFSGGITRFGVLQFNTVTSDVTSAAINNYSQFATQAVVFNLTSATHYTIADISVGAGSTITNQYGYRATAISTATNNYGFFGELTSGTNRWNLYMQGTAANYFAGQLLIGTATTSSYLLDVFGQVRFRTGTDVLTTATGLHYIGHNQNTQFIGFNFQGVAATDMFFGRGASTDDLIISTSNTASPAERVRFKQNGNVLIGSTSDNGQRFQVTGTSFFSDSVGIGTASSTIYNLRVGKTIVGAVNSGGIYQDGTVQSTVTSGAFGFYNSARTQAAAFTLTNYYHYYADQFALGVGSAITNQYGYVADSTLTGATNNFGFYGNIAAGTGRWNLYMNGTAANYLNGQLVFNAVGLTDFTAAATTHPIIIGGARSATLSPMIKFTKYDFGTADISLNYNNTFFTAGKTLEFKTETITLLELAVNNTSTAAAVRIPNGNLGLGVTPNTWNTPFKVIQIGASTSLWNISGVTGSSNNHYNDAANKYIANGFATIFQHWDGQFAWLTAPNNTSGAGAAATFTQAMTLNANGRLLLGSTTDNGLRFQVTGDASVNGSGNTSATTALSVRNSDGNNILRLRNDLAALFNFVGTSLTMSGIANYTIFEANQAFYFRSNGSTAGRAYKIFDNTTSLTGTTGTNINIQSLITFNPTSGTATYTGLSISDTINQTGGANGITRGLFVTPTLTAAADWRSIEWSNNTGWGLYGAGTAANYLNGNTGIGTNNIFGGVKLQVSGVAFVNNSANINYVLNSTGSHYGFIQNDAANKWSLSSGTSLTGGLGTAALTWFSSGNVSVGTTTDAGFRLDVNGTMRVSGASTFGSNINVNGISVGRGTANIATNAGFGAGVLTLNTTGFGNLALGYFSLYNNLAGYYNTAVGYDALYSNTDGFENIGIGFRALYNNTTGDDNIAIGYRAGFGGSANANTTGNNNIYIGTNAVGSSATNNNEIVIGNGTIGNGSNTATWGNASITNHYFTGSATFSSNVIAGGLLIGNTNGVNRVQINGNTEPIATLTATSGTASTNWNRNAHILLTGASVSNGLALGVSGTANDRKAWVQSGHPDVAAHSLGLLALNPLGGGVCIGNISIDASARLQVDSTTQGFLAPRMTAAQRTAISTPAVGLVVYQTDGTEGLYIYTNANGWKSLAIVN